MTAVASPARAEHNSRWDGNLTNSKRSLLAQVLGRAVGGDDEPIPVPERRESRQVMEEPDPRVQVAAFAGVLMQYEPLGDGEHSLVIEQGYEMKRPSLLRLEVKGDVVNLSGRGVQVIEGSIRL